MRTALLQDEKVIILNSEKEGKKESFQKIRKQSY